MAVDAVEQAAEVGRAEEHVALPDPRGSAGPAYRTPAALAIRRAVAGRSCMSPRASADERASGRKALSIRMMASTQAGSRPWAFAAAAVISSFQATGKRKLQAVEELCAAAAASMALRGHPRRPASFRRRRPARSGSRPLHEMVPFALEPASVPEDAELAGAAKAGSSLQCLDPAGGGGGGAFAEPVREAEPVRGEKAVVIALERDLGPQGVRASAKGVEGAGSPVPPAEFPARVGGEGIERGEAVLPSSFGEGGEGEQAEQAGSTVRVGNASEPARRFLQPIVLDEAEPDAPSRECVQRVREWPAAGRFRPDAGRRVRIAAGELGDGRLDRPAPRRIVRNANRAGYDPGGTVVVADPPERDGARRPVEHPGDVAGKAPVAVPKRQRDPIPEMFRGSATLAGPEGEDRITCVVLGAGHEPEGGRGLESGLVGPGLEQGTGAMAAVAARAAAGGERGLDVQEARPAALAGKAVEPELAYDVRHRGIRSGGEECFDLRFGTVGEVAAEPQIVEPRMQGVVPERFRNPLEVRPPAASERAFGFEEHDSLDGRKRDRGSVRGGVNGADAPRTEEWQ